MIHREREWANLRFFPWVQRRTVDVYLESAPSFWYTSFNQYRWRP